MPKHLGIPELLKFSVADFKMKLAIVIIALIGATLASPQDAPQPAAERTASPQDKPEPASERSASYWKECMAKYQDTKACAGFRAEALADRQNDGE